MAMLHRIIYCSTAKPDFELIQIKDILNTAVAHNRPHELTGVLLFNQNFFFQVIEGPSRVVKALYERILEDPRHESVHLISSAPLDNRQFEEWDMGFVIERPAAVSELKAFIDNGEFNPYQLSIESCLNLMAALKKELMENKVIATFAKIP